MTKLFSICSYLISVLLTVFQEPRILKEALVKDEKGNKNVNLPPKYWRKEVLKPLFYPDKVPNNLTNYFCPLFWVSNLFPIIWIMALVKFAFLALVYVACIFCLNISGFFNYFAQLRRANSIKWQRRMALQIWYDIQFAQDRYNETYEDAAQKEAFNWKTDEFGTYSFRGYMSLWLNKIKSNNDYVLFLNKFGDREDFLDFIKKLRDEQVAENEKLNVYTDVDDEEEPKEQPKFKTASWVAASKVFFKWFFIIVPTSLAVFGAFLVAPLVPAAISALISVLGAFLGAIFSLHGLAVTTFVLIIVGIAFTIAKLLEFYRHSDKADLENSWVHKILSFPLLVFIKVLSPVWGLIEFVLNFIKMTYSENCPKNEWKDEDEDKKGKK